MDTLFAFLALLGVGGFAFGVGLLRQPAKKKSPHGGAATTRAAVDLVPRTAAAFSVPLGDRGVWSDLARPDDRLAVAARSGSGRSVATSQGRVADVELEALSEALSGYSREVGAAMGSSLQDRYIVLLSQVRLSGQPSRWHGVYRRLLRDYAIAAEAKNSNQSTEESYAARLFAMAQQWTPQRTRSSSTGHG